MSWKRADTGVRNHYFSNGGIAHWNNLPDTAVIAPFVDVYKIPDGKSWSVKLWETEWNVRGVNAFSSLRTRDSTSFFSLFIHDFRKYTMLRQG